MSNLNCLSRRNLAPSGFHSASTARRLAAGLLAVCFGLGIAGRHAAALDLSLQPIAAARATASTTQSGLTVEALVREVLARNPGIEAMRAAADAAGARVESAASLDDPMVSYLVAPRTAGAPQNRLNQNIQLSQKFPWPGTLDLRSRMASAQEQSSEQQLTDLRLRLAALTRADFAQWYYVQRALSINAGNQELLSRLRKVAETAYASGSAPQQDVLQAEVELTRLQNQALQLKRMRRTVRARINTLRNVDPQAELAAPAALPDPHPLPKYAALRDAALAGYPMLRSLDAQITASTDRVALAHKNALPQFTLMAGYNGIMDLPDKRLTVGVAINIPFGGNHRGEIAEANAHLREAQARLADMRSRLLGELDQAYAAATQAADSIDLFRQKLLPLARLNLRAAEADYSGGNGDFLKLITAERQYLATQLEIAKARSDFFTQLAALDYRTAGAVSAPALPTTHGETQQ